MNDALRAMGAIDPVEAFVKTLNDVVGLVELYAEDDTPMTSEDFFMAVKTAADRLKAISMFTMASIMSQVTHKIDPVERAAFEAKMERDEFTANPEEQARKMLKVLQGLAKSMNQ